MIQTTFQKNSANSNQDKIDTLAQIVIMRIEELLSELDVRLLKSGNKLIGSCPIHGGKKVSSFNLWPDGHTVPGYWKCRSHHCEEVFKRTIIGFIRGVLSNKKYGWQKKGDKLLSFEETLIWCCKFIGQDLDKIKVDKQELERRRFTSQVDLLNKNISNKVEGISRNLVRSNLVIPADFFVKRGYSSDILNKFDVGLCDKQGKEMFNRIVVPIYDDSKNIMIGCTGRSIYSECPKCQSYHDGPCPSEQYIWLHSKWKHSFGFNTSSCLYNYWNAKKYVKESGVAILVEGPADVWRLEENGIHNSLALFGCEITDEQQILLEKSGAMSIILLLDNDEPGREGTLNIKSLLNRSYNIFTPAYKSKDIGEMSNNMVSSDLLPIIQNINLKNKSYSF